MAKLTTRIGHPESGHFEAEFSAKLRHPRTSSKRGEGGSLKYPVLPLGHILKTGSLSVVDLANL